MFPVDHKSRRPASVAPISCSKTCFAISLLKEAIKMPGKVNSSTVLKVVKTEELKHVENTKHEAEPCSASRNLLLELRAVLLTRQFLLWPPALWLPVFCSHLQWQKSLIRLLLKLQAMLMLFENFHWKMYKNISTSNLISQKHKYYFKSTCSWLFSAKPVVSAANCILFCITLVFLRWTFRCISPILQNICLPEHSLQCCGHLIFSSALV